MKSVQPVDEKYLIQDEVFDKIMSGRAILFVGAGFSANAINIDNTHPPTAKELSRTISKLASIPEDEDLKYTSDYYLTTCDPQPLIDILKRLYTITEVKECHETFCRVNWRRIYTTNYDNVIARGSNKAGKYINVISTSDSPDEFFKRHDVCVHINGNISEISTEALKTTFKLTQSSYVNPDSFKSSQWYYYFKKDLDNCSAIIFAGYSLYDIDIEKVLFAAPELKEKTYFVTKKDLEHKQRFLFEKYGTVLPVGIEAFSDHLKVRLESNIDIEDGFYTDAFYEYTLQEQDGEITDTHINKFLLNGILDEGFISNAATQIQKKPYIINRSQVGKVLSLLNQNKFIVFCSELGNGKTIFTKQLMATLRLNDRQVYYLNDEDGNYLKDVEKLGGLKNNIILVIERYDRYTDLVKFIAASNYRNIKVLLSARTSDHDRVRYIFKDFKLQPYEINLDLLDPAEKQQFISIIDNAGYWGEEAHVSNDRKMNIISGDGQNQISNTLLHLFNAPQIKDRIHELVVQICTEPANKKTLFAICLIEALDLPLKPSLISEVSGVDTIYDVAFRQNPSFLQLYEMKYGEVKAKSSIFSLHLLKHHFTPNFVVTALLDVVKKYYEFRNTGRHEREIYKSLLKFSTIEKILPERNKNSSLIKYYEDLKVVITFMKRDPHYWLQYAMARMAFNNYELAEKYLEQAYSLANSMDSYDTSYIDNQNARLLLLKSIEEVDPAKSFLSFDSAHKLLHKQNDDVYKYRQVSLYREIFFNKYPGYSAKNKVHFEYACKNMQRTLQSIYDLDSNTRYDHRALRVCWEGLDTVISHIVAARKGDSA